MEEYDKKLYKIKDVAELLNIPAATLRYWESEFPECKPRRSKTNIRYYSSKDIEIIKIINYLVKVKGLKLEAAKEQLRTNRKNISRRTQVLDTLMDTKRILEDIYSSLSKRR